MKKNRFLVLAVFMSLFSLPSTSQASIAGPTAVTDSNGQLLGIDGIDLLGGIWNVRFVEGSFDDLFGDTSGLDFVDMAGARAAATALYDVYNQPGFELYTQKGYATAGILYTTIGQVLTPYRVSVWNVSVIGFTIYPDEESDLVTDTFDTQSYTDTGTSFYTVYADWTNVSAVPVPAAVWFMGSGLLALFGYSRKKHKLT